MCRRIERGTGERAKFRGGAALRLSTGHREGFAVTNGPQFHFTYATPRVAKGRLERFVRDPTVIDGD
jgi:hypothetical protein